MIVANALQNRRKREQIALWQSHAFGNSLRSWNSVIDLLVEGYRGPVSVRCTVPDSKLCRYNVPIRELPALLTQLCKQHGVTRDQFYFGEMAPDEKLTLQGELKRGDTGWELTYSTVPGLRMRECLLNDAGVRHATGLAALAIVRQALTPSSFEDLMACFDRWPDRVLEFSAYRCTLGDLPGRNAIVWEHRDY